MATELERFKGELKAAIAGIDDARARHVPADPTKPEESPLPVAKPRDAWLVELDHRVAQLEQRIAAIELAKGVR